MSVYKEFAHTIREIEINSKQIFPDACDYGMVVKSLDDDILGQIRNHIDFYDLKKETITYSTGKTQKLTFTGGEGSKMEIGISKCIIEFITCQKEGMIGYLTTTIIK